jgi:hypothetical protein
MWVVGWHERTCTHARRPGSNQPTNTTPTKLATVYDILCHIFQLSCGWWCSLLGWGALHKTASDWWLAHLACCLWPLVAAWLAGWLHAFHSSRKASHLPLVMLANRAGRSDHMHCLARAMAGMPASVHPSVLCCNGLCRISATSPLALRRWEHWLVAPVGVTS